MTTTDRILGGLVFGGLSGLLLSLVLCGVGILTVNLPEWQRLLFPFVGGLMLLSIVCVMIGAGLAALLGDR